MMANMTIEELERQQRVQDRRLDSHSDDIESIKIWRAKVQGFLLALTIFASLPTAILGWAAVTGGFGR